MRARPSLGTLVGAALATAGLVVGTRSLGDNSFLTHLATGRLILDTGSVPRTDPYTFTAAGEPWVVQSWLASVLYAAIEELAGPAGIRVVVGAVFAGLVALAWALSRHGTSLLGRTAITGIVLLVGGGVWSERPLVLGLLLLGCTLLAAERQLPWWLLVPVGWIWANTHGSFPLGVALLAVVAAGTALDRRPVIRELQLLAGLVAGCLLGALGPLGHRALIFPVELLARQDLLQEVLEWQSPSFQAPAERLFLAQLVLAVWFLVRRPSWRHGLVLAAFGTLALLSVRNIAVASLVLVPGMAAGAPALGSLRAAVRPARGLVAGAVVAVLAALAVSVRLGEAHYELRDRYPIVAVEWLHVQDAGPLEVRTAVPDFVGNLQGLLYGPRGRVFYDDRFDMFPEDVSDDHLALLRGRLGWAAALDRWEIDLSLAPFEPWGALLAASDDWRIVLVQDGWLVACRRGADVVGC